jgi:vacuolar protein sorting-associated protein 13A/C
MAKELIVNTLVNILGDYVEGFTKENMKVGILSGKIVLKGLALNRDGIKRRLNLPIHIVHGHVELLEVHVPWKNLDKEHVQIYVNGIHMLLNPLRAETHSRADAQQQVYLFRKYRLFQAENSIKVAAQLTNAGDGMKRVSYIQNMIAKVSENLEFKVQNIHIRFEDPVKSISYGISLDSFSVITTDSNWVEAFVGGKVAGGQNKSRFKLARLQNLGIYWNSSSSLSSQMSVEEWLIYMKSASGVIAPVDHILQPPNEVTVKLAHQTPNLSVRIESVNLNMNLDKRQYHQIKETSVAVRSFHNLQRFIQHRPKQSPTEAPVAWWRYALLLLTEKECILKRKVCDPF